jgi:hypothetical protein
VDRLEGKIYERFQTFDHLVMLFLVAEGSEAAFQGLDVKDWLAR